MKSIIILGAFAALSTMAGAHMDDSGDIHPYVTVKENRFVVKFENSLLKIPQKMVVSKDGHILIKKIPDLKPDSKEDVEQSAGIPEKYRHFNLWSTYSQRNADASKRQLFGVSIGKERKGEFEVIQVENNAPHLIDLSWRASDIHQTLGFKVSADHFVILALHEVTQSPNASRPVFFHSVARNSKDLNEVELKGPCRIYDNPLISQICERNSKFYVAWMGLGWRGEQVAITLNLTEYDPNENRLKTKKLVEGHGNSHEILNNRALIAFHKPKKMAKDSYFGSQSEIVIRSLLLDEFDSIVSVGD